MAERPADKQNWQQRQYDSFGPHFRIESGNPEMGENGSVVYNLIGLAADNNTSAIGMNNGGLLSIMNDQTVDIIGGEKLEVVLVLTLLEEVVILRLLLNLMVLLK